MTASLADRLLQAVLRAGPYGGCGPGGVSARSAGPSVLRRRLSVPGPDPSRQPPSPGGHPRPPDPAPMFPARRHVVGLHP